jgi:hypothetical protein
MWTSEEIGESIGTFTVSTARLRDCCVRLEEFYSRRAEVEQERIDYLDKLDIKHSDEIAKLSATWFGRIRHRRTLKLMELRTQSRERIAKRHEYFKDFWKAKSNEFANYARAFEDDLDMKVFTKVLTKKQWDYFCEIDLQVHGGRCYKEFEVFYNRYIGLVESL